MPNCPAKINLFLAVVGKRPDGYHDLVSVAAPLAFGDSLGVTPADGFSLSCDHPAVPVDGTNLVLKAAQAFQAATKWKGGARFRLEKRIPIGAGLGGGSSNAATALLALNEMAGKPLSPDALAGVAAQVGSDCPLFLHQGPVILRGRGERIEPLSAPAAARLRGRRVLLFMPSFGVSTPWAYSNLGSEARRALRPDEVLGGLRYVAERADLSAVGLAKAERFDPPKSSSSAEPTADRSAAFATSQEAETTLATWLSSTAPAEKILFNALESPVFEKYVALPALLADIRRDFGFAAAMSGSGSCCFALLPPGVAPNRVQGAIAAIRAAYGPDAFVLESNLA